MDPTIAGSSIDNKNKVVDTECGPNFVIQHQTIHCLDEIDESKFRLPNVYSDCGRIVHLYNSDTYHDFGCQSSGFGGWFKKDNWLQSKIKGDGGVDVTGAPNALLVEGTSKASFDVVPGSAFSLEISIPANGVISFDWSIIGGSNLSFSAKAGTESIGRPARYFSSPTLNAGETFSLIFSAPANAQPGKVVLNNFSFFTDVVSVIERKWTAIDEVGNKAMATQFIAIKGIEPNQVVMPSNARNTLAAYYDKEIPTPEVAGYPLFDEDRDPTTTYDQTELKQSNCALDVSWNDTVEKVNNGRIIFRQWTIKQKCSGNIMRHTQQIRLYKNFDGTEEDEPQIRSSLFPTTKNGFGYDQKRAKSTYNFMSLSSISDMN